MKNKKKERKDKKNRQFPDITFKNAEKIKYRIVWKKPGNKYNASGLCDAPDAKQPEIWIDPELGEERLLEVLTEEIIHSHMWEKNEKTVR